MLVQDHLQLPYDNSTTPFTHQARTKREGRGGQVAMVAMVAMAVAALDVSMGVNGGQWWVRFRRVVRMVRMVPMVTPSI